MIDGSADNSAAARWRHICKGHKKADLNKDENYYHLDRESKVKHWFIYAINRQSIDAGSSKRTNASELPPSILNRS